MQSEDPHPESGSRPSRSEALAAIDAYLCGQPETYAEVERWILGELRHRYPGLSDEHEDLRDSIHEGLLTCLRAGRFAGRTDLKGYVVGIAHRFAIERIREIRRRCEDRRDPESESGERTGWDDPQSEVDPSGGGLLHRALLATSPTCRDMWRLVFIDKLHPEELAKRLSIPENAVGSRMLRCRRKLAATLARLRTTPAGSRRP